MGHLGPCHGSAHSPARFDDVLQLGRDVVLALALGAFGGHDGRTRIGRQHGNVLHDEGRGVGGNGVHAHLSHRVVRHALENEQGVHWGKSPFRQGRQQGADLSQGSQVARLPLPFDDHGPCLFVSGLGALA